MTFAEILKKLLNQQNEMVYTENGDLAYRHTVNANLVFFGTAGSMRQDPDQALRMFEAAYQEDRVTAVKNLFYLRDILGGLGEREVFRRCFRYLCDADTETAVKMFPYVVEYGRYDDLFAAYGTAAEKQMAAFVGRQLVEDLDMLKQNWNVSLLPKWMPSVNASSKQTRELARFFMKELDLNAASYRKMLSALRKGRILENNLREKDYTFDYQTVPSAALHKYRKAFAANDGERYDAYVRAAAEGKAFVNASAVFPYQIISEYKREMNETEQLAMQVKWDEMKRNLKAADQTIVVRDGSYSMTYPKEAILNSTALAILYAELLKGEFADKFITFSSRPQLIELDQGMNLYEKLKKTYSHQDITNTDIKKVYDLIFETSLRIKNPADYIKRVVIISDMQFDAGRYNVPTYEAMKRKFKYAGIPVPKVVYWNVNASRVQFAADTGETNVRYISGCTPQVIQALMKDNVSSPEEYMQLTLRKYDKAAKKVTRDEKNRRWI